MDTHTYKPTTVTLVAHARRGLINIPENVAPENIYSLCHVVITIVDLAYTMQDIHM